jgi:hypothetical protein
MAADIKAETIRTSWGFSVTCSAGTSVPVIVTEPEEKLCIQGIACVGAASTDITTVQDGAGKLLFKGAPIVNNTDKIIFSPTIWTDGLKIGFAGATTGACMIYLGK